MKSQYNNQKDKNESKDKISLTRHNELNQISYIYTHLIKLGYPKITKLALVQIIQIQQYLNSYFYSTSSREHLIQWLLDLIYPNYRESQKYKMQSDNIDRLIVSLWKIGVLPLSKHTKNLDYHKYVAGMLGYENSICLIYRMVQLALQIVYLKKSKIDTAFGAFFHEAIINYNDLINQNYDIYGITFPALYSDLPIQEFQKKYNQFSKQKLQPLKNKQAQFSESRSQMQTNEKMFNDLFQNASKNYKIFSQKYTQLVTNIKQLNQKYGSMIKRQQKQPVQERIQRRTLNISKQFCQKYLKMKKLISNIKPIPYNDQLKIKKQNIQRLIFQLNEINLQNFKE